MKNIILALVLCCTNLLAQYKNIKVNQENNGPNEVSIAVNPVNPQNIVAASNINNYYYTTDGGSTWSHGNIVSNEYGVWGDPCIIFDLKGNSYYIHLARPTRADWLDRIVCQKSTDWGATWNNPGTYTGLNPKRQQDKAWAACDWTDSKWKNSI